MDEKNEIKIKFWINPKIKPDCLEGKNYSDDILLIKNGAVFTGYYHYSGESYYAFLPTDLEDSCPVEFIPDGWLPRSELPPQPPEPRKLEIKYK